MQVGGQHDESGKLLGMLDFGCSRQRQIPRNGFAAYEPWTILELCRGNAVCSKRLTRIWYERSTARW